MSAPTVNFYDFHPPMADIKKEVLNGLSRQPKSIPPKFFYDRNGSLLFDKITELPEYYPTRTEIDILKEHGDEMATRLGEECLLLELGSGSSKKIRLLLDALQPAAYMPMDISKEHLLHSARTLATDYPDLEIHATCTDYSDDFHLPHFPEHIPKAAFFPGSSIGNFEPPNARKLLQRVVRLLGRKGALLIGVDLKKDRERLNAAYNDTQGITADFNLNLLTRINRELGADFKLSCFEHHAFYNEEQGRIEMHLVSNTPQKVKVDKQSFEFDEGESIHTENSYKYTIEQFHNLALDAGFQPEQVWTDPLELFSVHCLRAEI
ncbi:MAG: L-histidine N(alpha)-methyltransferase [Gammaproteobacteria bacterium]|nr:L-histidine N(alpha)-methyltransferase [Gammaproteobacteria bacterium]